MANDCTNSDDVFEPPVDNPPGNGNPDGGPVQEDIMDINANYCVNAEDPFQSGELTTPLELWELPEAGVEKPFTSTSETGTIKYMPYGNHALSSGSYSTIVGEEKLSVHDGVSYRIEYTKLLSAPVVDGLSMVIYGADKAAGDDILGFGPTQVSSKANGRAYVAAFWDLTTFEVTHAIKLDLVSRDVVLSRSPNYPGTNRDGDALGYNRTNLTSVNQPGTYTTGSSVTDRPARCYIGTRGGSLVTSTATSFTSGQAVSMNWSPEGRVLSTFGNLTSEEDERLIPLGVPDSIATGTQERNSVATTLLTIDLPSPVTSVTSIDMDITPFEPYELNKWLHTNRSNPLRNVSAAAMAQVHDPSGSVNVNDPKDYRVGVGRLGDKAGNNQYSYDIITNKTGLKMAVSYYNHTHKFKQSNSFAGTLKSVMEFRRADKSSPWEVYGSFTAPTVFDARWPDWETSLYNEPPTSWKASYTLTPFYDENDGDLWCLSHRHLQGFEPVDLVECFKPDLAASSHARSIGTVSTASYRVNTPAVVGGGRILRLTDHTDVAWYNLDQETNLYTTWTIDFATGTVTKQANDAAVGLPPRLAHLDALSGNAIQKWNTRPSQVTYNGFTIVGIQDTPAVPNAALGSYSFWTDQDQYGSPDGTYKTNSSRRIMMRIGEISAVDSNGAEVWRAEPPDARAWARFNTDTRTMGRSMMFYNHGAQSNIPPNPAGIATSYSSAEVRNIDPVFADMQGSDGINASFYPSVGINAVKFGESMFLVGTNLYVSHASLPSGYGLPPEGDFNVRRYYIDRNTTPRDATELHESGYVVIDLSTIPELNP